MLELTLIIKWKVPKIVVVRKLACKISISNKWTIHKLCRFSNRTCLSTYWFNYGLRTYLSHLFPQLHSDVWAFIFQQMKSCIGQLVASCVKKNLLDVKFSVHYGIIQKVFLQMYNCFFPYIPRKGTWTWWCNIFKVLFKCTRKMINLHTIWFFGTCFEILTYTSTNPCLSIVLSLTICPQLMVCIIYFLFTTFLHTWMH